MFNWGDLEALPQYEALHAAFEAQQGADRPKSESVSNPLSTWLTAYRNHSEKDCHTGGGGGGTGGSSTGSSGITGSGDRLTCTKPCRQFCRRCIYRSRR